MKNLPRAISLCLKIHNGAVRKWDKETPYSVHSLWCALTFLQETNLPESINREECALALLFHDSQEDTKQKLPGWVPENVVELVDLMSFSSRPGSTRIEIRKIWNLPPIVRLLKLYDKASNLLDGCWMSYRKWNKQYIPYVLRLADDVEANYGDLNIVRMSRAVAIPRSLTTKQA